MPDRTVRCKGPPVETGGWNFGKSAFADCGLGPGVISRSRCYLTHRRFQHGRSHPPRADLAPSQPRAVCEASR